jgi:hypothetical protein
MQVEERDRPVTMPGTAPETQSEESKPQARRETSRSRQETEYREAVALWRQTNDGG